MRLLIVGAGGFIGEYLCRHLAGRGYAVRAVDGQARLQRLEADDSASGNIERHEREIARIEATDPIFSDVDAVIHLYSSTSPASSMRNIGKDADANILLSIRLLEACRENGIGLFIFASSGGAVYGEVSGQAVSEQHETNPINAYGAAKLSVEKYMRLFNRHYDIRTVALRIANAYGPGQLRGSSVGAVANFVRRVYGSETIDVWGDGSTIRDYVYISDVASAFELSIATGGLAAGEYNVGTGIGHSVKDVIEQIELLSGRGATVRHHPARTVDVPRLVLDSSKFRSATGWEPKIALSEGIRALCESAFASRFRS